MDMSRCYLEIEELRTKYPEKHIPGFCPRCGTGIRENAVFCVGCGRKLAAAQGREKGLSFRKTE